MSEIVRMGMDILEISRFQLAVKRNGKTFLDRILTQREMSEIKEDLYPVLFSAKESLIKLTGGLPLTASYLQIEVSLHPQSTLQVELYAPYSHLVRQMQMEPEYVHGIYRIYNDELICTSLTYCIQPKELFL